MKVCSKCKVEKDESEFHKRKASKDGLRGVCKDCMPIINYDKYEEKRKLYFQSDKYKDLRKAYQQTTSFKESNIKSENKRKQKTAENQKKIKAIRDRKKEQLQKEKEIKKQEKINAREEKITKETKICSCCKKELNKKDFRPNKSNVDKLNGFCRICHRIRDAKYSRTEKYREIQRNYMRKIRQTDAQKEYIKSYSKSENFKNNQKKYSQSEKGRDRSSNIKNILGIKGEDRKLIPIEVIELKRIQMKKKKKIKEIENENQ